MKSLPRRESTDFLVAFLSEGLGTVPVGDGVAPNAGGWSGGAPNVGEFVPYLVVRLVSGTVATGRSIGREWSAWDLTFDVSAFGGSRPQCDWVGDTARAWLSHATSGRGQDFLDVDGDTWRFGGARIDSVSGPSRVDAVDPPYWQSTDRYTFSTDRSRMA